MQLLLLRVLLTGTVDLDEVSLVVFTNKKNKNIKREHVDRINRVSYKL